VSGGDEYRTEARTVNERLKFAVQFSFLRRVPSNGSDHAELHSTGFADHVLVPRRIPYELHVGFVDSVYA
jgi:hypothetical protein